MAQWSLQPTSDDDLDLLARQEMRMRALAAAGALAAVAGLGLLGDARQVADEDAEARRPRSGIAVLFAAVLLLAAAFREHAQRDLLRRRIAPHLAPPPSL